MMTTTPPRAYHPLRSFTVLGTALAGVAGIVKQVAPQYGAAATIAEAIGGMIAAHGVRKAIAKNGTGR